MRLQDKLLHLYQGSSSAGLQRYLVRELDRVVAGLDSDRLVTQLERAAEVGDAGKVFQSHRSLARLLPRHVARRYGVPDLTASSGAVVMRDGVAVADPASEARVRIVSFLAQGVAARLLTRVPRLAGPARLAALRAVAPLAIGGIDDALARLAEADPPDPMAAYLLARRLDPRDAPARLGRIAELARTHPDLAVAMAEGASLPPVGEALVRLADGKGSAWQVPVAIALEGAPSAVRRPVLERISESRHGWGIVHALASLSRNGTGDDLPWILDVYRRFDVPIVRVEAARCLGRMHMSIAREACRRIVARDPSSIEAAAALESLARQGIPDGERQAVFGGALESSNPEVVGLACLGLAAIDPDRAVRGVRDLFASGTEGRIHGVHLLGYLPSEESARLLGRLACQDPEAIVRRQAVASLAYHPPSAALAQVLAEVLPRVEEAHKPWVARALVRDPAAAGLGLLDVLVSVWRRAGPRIRPEILAAIGQVGSSEAMDLIESTLKANPERDGIAGCLMACATSGKRWRHNPGHRFLHHGDHAIAGLASLAVLQDDAEASLSALEPLMAAEGPALEAGIQTLGTIALIATHALAHPRYGDLVRRLKSIERSDPYSAFSSQAVPRQRPDAGDLLEDPGAQVVAPSLRAGRGLGRSVADVTEGGRAGRPMRTAELDVRRLDRPLGPVVPVWTLALAAAAVIALVVGLLVALGR